MPSLREGQQDMKPHIFKDHFSGNAQGYSQYRPGYPGALFQWLANSTQHHQLAWDCATGNGQAAGQLATYYQQVIASDASAHQLAQAAKKPNIHYQLATAEAVGIASESTDLITVAQALHWFDIKGFSNEVLRILKPAGILAAWTYKRFSVAPAIDHIIHRLEREKIAPYWPKERRMVEDGYRTIHIPMKEQQVPSYTMEAQWDLTQLMGYLDTWSAVKEYRKDKGECPVAGIAEELETVWGGSDKIRRVQWPFVVRVWRK
jgi:ubiquinone/menaquinone biosynthesis C-methylase UbiE